MAPISTTLLSPRLYSPRQRGVPVAEARLHEAAAELAWALAPPGLKHLIVISELEICGVRPDLWIGSFDIDNFQRRHVAGLEPCTAPYPLAVAHALRRLGGQASINHLTSSEPALGERRRVRRGVCELIDRGLAFRDDGAVVLHPAFAPAQVRGVGVEAKVGRWRKAVRQVQMWRAFVNGAWLVFPRSYLAHVPRQRPGLRNLGIVVVDAAAGGHVIRQPRLTVGRAFPRTMVEEHIYARWRLKAATAPAHEPRDTRAGRTPAATRALAPAR